MRGSQSGSDLNCVLHCFARGNATCLHALAKRIAFQQFGDKKVNAVLRSNIVNGKEVRMIERAQNARFIFETVEALAILGEGGRKNLDRYSAGQPRVSRPIDLAHSASPQR